MEPEKQKLHSSPDVDDHDDDAKKRSTIQSMKMDRKIILLHNFYAPFSFNSRDPSSPDLLAGAVYGEGWEWKSGHLGHLAEHAGGLTLCAEL